MADGKAAQQATVVEGDARFEVLAPEVIRLEYSPTGSFLDEPTFDILDRNLAVPAYTTTVQNGWLVMTTSGMVLRYQVGSGPFTPANTQMQLLDALAGASANVSPTWEWECTFGQVCQSGAASLSGGAIIASDHQNHVSPAGFIAGLTPARALHGRCLGRRLVMRKSPSATPTTSARLGGPAPRTIEPGRQRDGYPGHAAADVELGRLVHGHRPVSFASGTNTVGVDLRER